jgi:2-methylcitrate dehydratase PrpD
MSVAERLAEFATSPVRLPDDVIRMAKQIFANAAALALASWEVEPASIAFAIVESLRTPAQATVWGRNARVGVGWAALLNGIAVHYEDFDDTHMRTLLHPGPVIVPASVAIMEYCGASSDALLEGIVFGTEIAMRIGNGISPAHYERGWHVTSTMGRLGASIAAARILGLSAEQTCNALAIAALEGGGVTAALGTMTKPFHPGKSAFDGIEAALLARQGVSGAPDAIEAANGLAGLMSDHLDEAAIFEGLGERWEIVTNSFKPYSCGLVSHPIIDAAIELRDAFAAGDIARIDVTAHPLVLDLMGKPDPGDGLESKFSAYHCAAIGFLYGAGGPAEFSDACARDANVRALRSKVEIAISTHVPVGAARMRVVDRHGNSKETQIQDATGSIDAPMSALQLEKKARALLGPRFGDLQRLLAGYGIAS